MQRYECECGEQWQTRTKAESWVTQCPCCGKKKTTKGKGQEGERPELPINGQYGEDRKLNFPEQKE